MFQKKKSPAPPLTSSRVPVPVFIYSDGYDLQLTDHVFPSVKFGLIYRRLRADPAFANHRFIEPMPATYEDAATVHKKEYLRDLATLNHSRNVHRSELPLNREIIDAFFLAAGGTMLAAELALGCGRAMNLSGGFHHAFADHAEGFCYLNDVAIAIRVLQKQKMIKRALIVDLDVHQGNGSARIFRHSSHVFTFSMHEEKNYPVKERGRLDVGLATAIRDNEYLFLLEENLDRIRRSFEPDLIFFVAGVDPYEEDRLGGMSLTKEGLRRRDVMVRDAFPGIPLVAVLAGGYAMHTDDTVELHVQTARVLADLA